MSGEDLFGDYLNDNKQSSANLKGTSSFTPIGLTPREEELALIESLTKGVTNKNLAHPTYKGDTA